MPASHDPLRTQMSNELLQVLIDTLCRLNSSSPPMLLRPDPVSSTVVPPSDEAASGQKRKRVVPTTSSDPRSPDVHVGLNAADLVAELPVCGSGGSATLAIRGELRPVLEHGLATAIM